MPTGSSVRGGDGRGEAGAVAHIYADRVVDTTATVGISAFVLDHPDIHGHRNVRDVCDDADTIYYSAAHHALDQWETGLGTYGAGLGVLVRTTILESSNAGAAVSFSSGRKDIVCGLPAAGVADIGAAAASAAAASAAAAAASAAAVAAPGTHLSLGDVRNKIVSGTAVTIKWWGDSITYGFMTGGPVAAAAGFDPSLTRAANQPPEQLGQCLSSVYTNVTVVNAGHPGDSSADGYARMVVDTARPDVIVMMYGTNDVNTVGHQLTPTQFRAQMAANIALHQGRGAYVVVMSPPPLNGSNTDRVTQTYGEIARQVAQEAECRFVDTAAQLRSIVVLGSLTTNLWTDGVHLTATAYNELGWHLAALFLVSSMDGGAPQTASLGPALARPDTVIGPAEMWGAAKSQVAGSVGGVTSASGVVFQSWAQGVLQHIGVDVLEPVYPVIGGYEFQGALQQFQLFYAGGSPVTHVQQVTGATDYRRFFRGPQILYPGLRVISTYVPVDGGYAASTNLETLAFVSSARSTSLSARGTWRKGAKCSASPFPSGGGSVIEDERAPQTPWRVEAKVTLPTATNTGLIFAQGINGASDIGATTYLRIYRTGDTSLRVLSSDGAYNDTLTSIFTPSTDYTGVLAVTYDGTNLKIYQDGSQIGSYGADLAGVYFPGITSIGDPTTVAFCHWMRMQG